MEQPLQQSVSFEVKPVVTATEAALVSRFLLSEYSFDDQRFTPGEILHFQQNPLLSVHLSHQHFWYVENDAREVIGAISVMENEQRTGGYIWDYIAVHRHYRKRGIAALLYRTLLEYVQSQKGRYIIAYTCDLPEYASVRRIFKERGFEQSGFCPDYYYEGEGRLTYLKKL